MNTSFNDAIDVVEDGLWLFRLVVLHRNSYILPDEGPHCDSVVHQLRIVAGALLEIVI